MNAATMTRDELIRTMLLAAAPAIASSAPHVAGATVGKAIADAVDAALGQPQSAQPTPSQ